VSDLANHDARFDWFADGSAGVVSGRVLGEMPT